MNKSIKNTTIYTLLLAVVFLNITFETHASDLQNTGDNVEQKTNSSQTGTSSTENNNDATIAQQVNATANTGFNMAERNISIGGNAGMITTGNAGILTTAQIGTNENTTVLAGTNTAHPYSINGITNTGNSLTASSTNDVTQLTAVQNSNKTTVIQNVNAEATTGGNTAPRNISMGGQAGVIETGNAYTGTSMLIAGNGNVALLGGENNGNGPGSGASVVLLNTGDRGRVKSTYANENAVDVNNVNLLAVRQQCGVMTSCIADTGHNTANRNINTNGDAGVIETGNALIAVSAAVQGNSNATAVNNLGQDSGQNTNLANTGDDISTSTSTQQSNSENIKNVNDASLAQDVNAYANSGWNTANRNIAIGGDAGIIKTGAATIATYLTALVNSNTNQ